MVRYLAAGLVACYLAVIVPFTAYLKHRPVVVKLGYTPDPEILKVTSGDLSTLIAEMCVLKVLFYYGTVTDRTAAAGKPEYYNMFKTVETAIRLDPYNLDAYYFAQASFTWEVGRAKDVNRLLAYGMKYRTKDWTLPFYIAFNDAYFLRDYADAAHYMQKAADLSHEPLFTTLAARYFYESGRTDLGILFLANMEQGSRDQKVKNVFEIRRKALLAVKVLDEAVARFKTAHHRMPATVSELVSSGEIPRIPEDPYGGRFYLEGDGKVRSTSKFAFGGTTR
ncbi:hypothetical protein [Geomesophilobacter sediminis]|uniref:Pilus assembly protein PilG n=1 Tax=Geomesophilobacter sediminis TaxID=2798584 RepID=A0A8J7IP83_9BACT|nr:hypothetical protein [Geomesophilobacter sediminis]MBJ6724084.1 hypothetical protein [Geomesophilobacter sediminis]